jgi:hypothetical protein
MVSVNQFTEVDLLKIPPPKVEAILGGGPFKKRHLHKYS